MEDFIKTLKGVKPDIDFEHETALVDDGLLESLDIISIISEISEVYGVACSRYGGCMFSNTQYLQSFILGCLGHFLQGAVGVSRHDGMCVDVQ